MPTPAPAAPVVPVTLLPLTVQLIKFNEPVIRERFGPAAAYLGIDGGFDGFCAFVDEFNNSFSIPKSLTELGVKDPDLDWLTAAALRDPSTGGNPVKMTPQNTRALIEALL